MCTVPAVTVCNTCGKTYGTVEHGRICPYCHSEDCGTSSRPPNSRSAPSKQNTGNPQKDDERPGSLSSALFEGGGAEIVQEAFGAFWFARDAGFASEQHPLMIDRPQHSRDRNEQIIRFVRECQHWRTSSGAQCGTRVYRPRCLRRCRTLRSVRCSPSSCLRQEAFEGFSCHRALRHRNRS